MARYNAKNIPDNLWPTIETALNNRDMERLFDVYVKYRVGSTKDKCCPSGEMLNIFRNLLEQRNT